MKLLYLLELECFRAYGRRLTELDWIFYHYGPYPPAIEVTLSQSRLVEEDVDLKGGRTLKGVSIDDEQAMDALSEGLQRLADRIVRDWSTADLNDLLNYVYFETEPMLLAKRGEQLDFSRVRPYPPRLIPKTEIDRARLKDIRARLVEHITRRATHQKALNLRRSFTDILAAWGPLEPTPVDTQGEVSIIFSPDDEQHT